MYEGAVQDLIDELGQLPGVGPKSAQRIAFHLLAADPVDVRRLVHALTEVKDKVRFCRICGNVSEQDECRVCRDPRRDDGLIVVVADISDLWALERSGAVPGRYHVLGGVLSALDGVRPEHLSFDALVARASDPAVTEVILALSATVDDALMGLYLAWLVAANFLPPPSLSSPQKTLPVLTNSSTVKAAGRTGV